MWDTMLESLLERLFEYLSDFIHSRHHRRNEFFTIAESVEVSTHYYNEMRKNKADHSDVQRLVDLQLERMGGFIKELVYVDLETMYRHWHAFQMMERWFRLFFFFLNRSFLRLFGHPSQHMLSLYKTTFYTHYLKRNQALVFRDVTTHLFQDREKTLASTSDVGSLTLFWEILSEMETYVSADAEFYWCLESHLLEHYDLHCRALAQEWQFKIPLPEFIDNVLTHRSVESTLSNLYPMLRRSLGNHYGIVRTHLLEPFQEIVQTHPEYGLTAMLRTDNELKIQSCFRFLSLLGNDASSGVYKSYLEKTLEALVTETADPLVEIFQKDRRHYRREEWISTQKEQVSRDVWKQYFSSRGQLISILARAMDHELRVQNHATTDSLEENPRVESLLCLFEFLPDKDVFQAQYRHLLRLRLLEGNVPLDYERTMLDMLRQKMGSSYILSLRTMVNDVQNHRDRGSSVFCGTMVDLMVISGIAWGASRETWQTLQYPGHLHQRIQSLHEELGGENKRFDMVTQWGKVTLRAHLSCHKYHDLNMSSLQAVVCMMLPRTESDLIENVFVHDTEREKQGHMVRAALKSLSGSKFPLLIKDPKTDQWCLNTSMENRRRNIVVPKVHLSSSITNSDSSSTTALELDREMILDSIMMRIMKSRRTLEHSQLLMETRNQIQLFSPEVSMMKKRIQSLLERDYLRRDETQNHIYHYVL